MVLDFVNTRITRDKIIEYVKTLKEQYEQMGGWKKLTSGEWLFSLIVKSFKDYYQNANHSYFNEKYQGKNADYVVKKLTSVASRNAMLLGGVTGTLMSTDEIVALTTAGEGGVGIPANIAIAGASIAADTIGIVSIQLQLIANIAILYGCPLNPDDPEDILTIINYALGGTLSEAAGNAQIKAAANLAQKGVRKVIKGDVLKTIQKIAAKAGIKILQRTLVKLVVPVVSVGIGAVWNFATIKTTAKIACTGLKNRIYEVTENKSEASSTKDVEIDFTEFDEE